MKKLIDTDVISTKTEHFVDSEDPSWNYSHSTVEIAPGDTDNDIVGLYGIKLRMKEDPQLADLKDEVSALCIELPLERVNEMSKRFVFKSTEDNTGGGINFWNGSIEVMGWDDDYNQTFFDMYKPVTDWTNVKLTEESTGIYSLAFDAEFLKYHHIAAVESINVIATKKNSPTYSFSLINPNSGVDTVNTEEIKTVRMKYGSASSDVADVFVKSLWSNTGKTEYIKIDLTGCAFDSGYTFSCKFKY